MRDNNPKTGKIILAAILFSIVLAASLPLSKKDSSSSPKTEKVDLLSGENALLTVDSLSIEAGQGIQLEVDYYKGDIIWSSYDSSIASVSEDGIVKGESPGTTCIFAQCQKYMLTCTVRVRSKD